MSFESRHHEPSFRARTTDCRRLARRSASQSSRGRPAARSPPRQSLPAQWQRRRRRQHGSGAQATRAGGARADTASHPARPGQLGGAAHDRLHGAGGPDGVHGHAAGAEHLEGRRLCPLHRLRVVLLQTAVVQPLLLVANRDLPFPLLQVTKAFIAYIVADLCWLILVRRGCWMMEERAQHPDAAAGSQRGPATDSAACNFHALTAGRLPSPLRPHAGAQGGAVAPPRHHLAPRGDLPAAANPAAPPAAGALHVHGEGSGSPDVHEA